MFVVAATATAAADADRYFWYDGPTAHVVARRFSADVQTTHCYVNIVVGLRHIQ